MWYIVYYTIQLSLTFRYMHYLNAEEKLDEVISLGLMVVTLSVFGYLQQYRELSRFNIL